jgi:hypothetical protein
VEDTAYRRSPNANIRRLPRRSAARPPSSRKPPNVTAYALTTHCSVCPEKPSPLPIRGSATYTML